MTLDETRAYKRGYDAGRKRGMNTTELRALADATSEPARYLSVSLEPTGWKEAAIAWEVCASIHRSFAKGKDALFKTRQADFIRHAGDARKMLAAAQAKEE